MSTQCPLCNASLKARQILSAGRFRCPVCHGEIRASGGYGQCIFWATLSVLIGTFWILNYRDEHLIYAVLIALVPAHVLVLRTLKYVIPPDLEPFVQDLSLNLKRGPRS